MDQKLNHGEPPVAQKGPRDVDVLEEDHATRSPAADRNDLRRRLRATGMAPAVADDLIRGHPLPAVRDALDALDARRTTNSAGWLVGAITERWDLKAKAAPGKGPAAIVRSLLDADAARLVQGWITL